MTFLDSMARHSSRRVAEAMAGEPLSELRARAADTDNPPAYNPQPFEVWAELKPTSPSEGELDRGVDLSEQARAYQAGGASVLSVLTEPTAFGGSLRLLAQIRESTTCPIMRKDFLVDPYQVWEARAVGAAGVLLVIRMLSDKQLGRMMESASDAGLFVLLEAFDQAELDRAALVADRSSPEVILGVNCRDLTTLEVDRSRFDAIELPRYPVLAESGIETSEHVEQVAMKGFRGVLMGTALMRSADPAHTVATMVAAGRATCRSV